MTTESNPADAVREALENGIQWMSELHSFRHAHDRDRAHANALARFEDAKRHIAALTERVADTEKVGGEWADRALLAEARLAALAGAAPVAPWLDFAGQTIQDRDRIRHPDGTTGVVLYLPDMGAGGEAWRVVYSGGDISRLALQVGDKGQAIVIEPHAPAKAREELSDAQLDAIYNALDEWVLSLADYDFAMPSITDAARNAMRAALATFAEGAE